MELRSKNLLRLCLVVAILPITQVHAEYYNNALNVANRGIKTTMQAATAAQTAGSAVTSIKNQGEMGTCWSFATNAAVEASLMSQMQKLGLTPTADQFDFSERYTAWMMYSLSNSEKAGKQTPHTFFIPTITAAQTASAGTNPDKKAFLILDQGGTVYNDSSAYMGNFMVEESTNKPALQYYPLQAEASKNIIASAMPATYKARDIFIGTDANSKMGLITAGDITPLQKYKDLIKSTGSIRVNYLSTSPTSTNGAIYNSVAADIDHAILVVGYDDDYDFADSGIPIQPPGKGAWIVKNSWGATYVNQEGQTLSKADAGYYYISYYDKTATFSSAVNMESDIARYTVTNTNTPLYTGLSFPDIKNPAYASTYKPADNQFLKAVSFMTNSDGATYKIEIIKNSTSPKATPIYSQTGTFAGDSKASGYHTIDLNSAILMPKNENYVIRITVTGNSGGIETLNVFSLAGSPSTSSLTLVDNKSYCKDDKGNWLDLNKGAKAYAILNGQSKETTKANGADFTVGSLSCTKASNVVINLGKADELYGTDIFNTTRKTLSNMTANINLNEDFYGTIKGEGGVTKTGTGELSFRENNTYTGITNVNQGTLSNYKSIESNADVKTGATYRIINEIKQSIINERGIANAGSVFIAAKNKSTIKFANTEDSLTGTVGTWYLNTLDNTPLKKATDGTIIIDAKTDAVEGNIYIAGGTVKVSAGQTKLFTNPLARKIISNGAVIDSQSKPITKSSVPSGMMFMSVETDPIAELDLGNLVIEGTAQIDMDVVIEPSTLTSDLIKGTVVTLGGAEDDTPNKIKLGFTLDQDVTFADAVNGVSANVAQGQIGKVINNSAFVINRNEATGSYNIYYNYAGTDGTLKMVNAAAPMSLQEAIVSAVTSKYYAINSNQVLDSSWDATLAGNDLTLVGNNTVMDGDNTTQVFNISADKMLTIKDVSVVKGTGTAINNEGTVSVSAINSEVNLEQNDGSNGGAIYSNDELTLLTSGNNIKFQDNTAVNGAGIYNDAGSVNNSANVDASTALGDIIFENNEASLDGGAVYNKGNASLWADGGDIQLNNNKAQSGAGVYNTGSLSVYSTDKAVEFNKNVASVTGGAILNNGGNVEILTQGGNVNFVQNEAANGGAIYNTKPGGATDPAVVDIVAEEGSITFDGNVATDEGGAIYNTETVNILALDDQKVSFKQSTDKIYNTGIVNLNYNSDYDSTNGLILTGAEFGGAGIYNLYGGELAFVKASNNPTTVGSISHDSTLSVINDAYLNLANGIKETFNPGTLTLANSTALFVGIDCILSENISEGDFLDAGTFNEGTDSQIIIAAVNLLNPNNANKASYRIRISDDTLWDIISENVLAEIAGYRSAFSQQTGDLLLLSDSVIGLVDFVDSDDTNRTYSMTDDESVIFPLGTMGGENSTLTIEGNNNKIISEFSDIDGITVSATNTLNVKNVDFEAFETAITNKGVLNLNNVIFNGQVGPSIYDVNNSARMTAENIVTGRVLNSGTFIAGKVNDLSNLSLRTIDGSAIDLRSTTNDVNFDTLSIAGNVDLLLNGSNKLSSTNISRDAGTDALVIKSIDKLTSVDTTVTTDTNGLKEYIKIADDAIYTLAASAKPIVADAYKLTYSDTTGIISVSGVTLGDNSTKTGSLNIDRSADFVASATNTVATGSTVYMDASGSGLLVNILNDTTVEGTLGVNSLTLNGQKLIVDNSDTARLELIDSTVHNALELNGGNTEIKNSSLSGDINIADSAVLSFTRGVNTVNGAIIGVAGSSLVIDSTTVFNNTVDPVTETVNSLAIHNANVSEVDFIINKGGELKFTKDSYLNNDHTNTVNFDGGALNLMNGAANTVNLQSLTFAPASESASVSYLFVDVDLANQTMDKLDTSTMNIGSGAMLNIAGMRLLSDARGDNTSINFTNSPALMDIVDTSVSNVAYSPIYQYLVGYNGANGNFDFTRSVNPAVLASSIGAQVGSYLTQLNSYEQAFGNMDMMMSMTTEQRQAMKLANKYADASEGANLTTFSPNQIPEQDKGLWFRPYTTFENVGLKNGPTVGNVAYGSLFGGDTPIIELKNGWDAVYTGYAGYNGSHQTYDGAGIYQSGATLGATGVFYKGNFFTGLTANVGANAAEANTMYGKEDFTMLATGVASKTGYNLELADGKFIVQPNFLMSYSFVNTFDYTNAAGVNITSDPLNAIQIAPGIKFIGNLKNGWQPYAVAQMVWNIMDQTRFRANDVSLPELSIKPYIQYGIGLQKRWGERFTGYGQVLLRNGGRNGIALQMGFRFALGKDPSKMGEASKRMPRCAKAEPTKCNVNLQSFKSDEQIVK